MPLPDLLNLVGAVILIVGLTGSVLIYLTPEKQQNNVLGYEEGNGSAYPIRPEDSKLYQRDLELYGGKASLLADQFRRWFIGLWHGRSLAYTAAFMVVLVSFGFFYVAHRFKRDGKE